MTSEKSGAEDLNAIELANTIHEIGLLVHKTADPEQVIQLIARRIRDELDADFVGICLMNEERQTLDHKWGALPDGGTVPEGHFQSLGEGVVGRAASTGQAVYVHDTQEAWDYVAIVPGIRSEAALPLVYGGRVIGVLDVESRRKEAFGPEEMALLEALTSAVTLAMENAQLVDKQRKRLGKLTLLNRISRVMTSTVDLDELLERTAEGIRELLGYDLVAIGLVDGGNKRLEVRAVASLEKVDLEVGRAVPFGEGVTGKVVESGESVLIPDVTDFEGYVEVFSRIRSEMCTPLRVRERVFGFLDAESVVDDAFDEDDLTILEGLAEHISRAVENALNLSRMNQLREDISTMLVDQMQRPLSSIQVALEGLEIDLDSLGGDVADAESPGGKRLRNWLRAADGARSEVHVMIDALADLSLIESGKLELERDHTPPSTLVVGVWERMQVLADSRGVALDSQIEEGLPTLYVDQRLLIRVLQNLTHAALQLTPRQGAIALWVVTATEDQVRRHLPEAPRAMLFTVHHTGRALPEEELGEIFEKFRVLETGTSGQKYSTGLGLAFCREAVAAHGGSIWVESVASSGNAFHVLLPIAAGPPPKG